MSHIGPAKPFYASSPHWGRQPKSGRTPTIVDSTCRADEPGTRCPAAPYCLTHVLSILIGGVGPRTRASRDGRVRVGLNATLITTQYRKRSRVIARSGLKATLRQLHTFGHSQMESRPGLTHDLRRTRKSAGHGPESIIEDVNVTNVRRNGTSHMRTSWAFAGGKGISRQESAADTVGKHCGVTRGLSPPCLPSGPRVSKLSFRFSLSVYQDPVQY